MATAALNRYTPEEYLALERHAEFRSEYIDGQIIAMSPGALRPHNLIVAALVYELQGHLMDGPCEVYPSTQRVKVSASGDYLYPDVVVSCDPQFEAGGNDNLLTPVLIVEVLSDSTARHDREKKFSLYKRIDTLCEYVLISQKDVLVEQYVRQGDFWARTEVTDLESSIALASLGLKIPLRRLYRKALTPTRRVPRAVQAGE
ncbi:Uma2 family endonuclease [Longimicrobium sp.]|uniref:Uma2 family endonuclease n=1 Tax=Longimicrobium sp. TaxID=2029185 RepID=UPI003B3A5AF9